MTPGKAPFIPRTCCCCGNGNLRLQGLPFQWNLKVMFSVEKLGSDDVAVCDKFLHDFKQSLAYADMGLWHGISIPSWKCFETTSVVVFCSIDLVHGLSLILWIFSLRMLHLVALPLIFAIHVAKRMQSPLLITEVNMSIKSNIFSCCLKMYLYPIYAAHVDECLICIRCTPLLQKDAITIFDNRG